MQQGRTIPTMTYGIKRGCGDGEPPSKRLTDRPPTQPDPPDELALAMTARRNANLPPLQCLLQFLNRDPGTLCYVGSGCNLMCCAPTMTQFLAQLPASRGQLLYMLRALALRRPNQPIQPQTIRNRLIAEVPAVDGFSDGSRHHDAQEFVNAMLLAVNDLLPLFEGQQWRRLYGIGISKEYVCDGPDHHCFIKAPNIDEFCSMLSVPLIDTDKVPITSIEKAIEADLSLDWTERRCGQCDSQWAAEHSTITSAPNVLFVHYKRFEAVELPGGDWVSQKLHHDVDAKPVLYLAGQKYDLTGVLVHRGPSANSGHYYFDTVCPPYLTTGRAYRSDNDREPQIISTETLMDDIANAYMLAYQKAAGPASVQVAATSVPPLAEQSEQRPEETASTDETLTPGRQTCENGTPIDIGTSSTATSSEHDEEKRRVIALVAERDEIQSIGLKERSDEQIRRLRQVCKLIKQVMNVYPEITAKKPARSAADRKATYKQNQSEEEKERVKANDKTRQADKRQNRCDEEKEAYRANDRDRKATDECRAKDRERLATDENRQKDRDRKATEANRQKCRERLATDANRQKDRARKATAEYKAANLQQKTAKKAGITVKAKDGLKTDLIFSGKFGVELNSLGAMDNECQHCGARHFKQETATRMCCVGGKVVLARFQKPADALLRLLFNDDFNARTFRKFVRSFNNALCLSSLRFNERSFRNNYKPSVVIEGRVHQFFGSLLEKQHETPRFAQLWVHDPAMQTTQRIANMSLPGNISEAEAKAVTEIVETLQAELRNINPWIKDFRQIVEIEDEELRGGKLVISAKAKPAQEHARRYNLTANLREVSILTDCKPHDLIVTKRDGKLEVVSELNRAAMPLHFTLLVPHGDYGWHNEMRNETGKRLTTMQFAAYHMAVRDAILTYDEAAQRDICDYIYLMGRLWQEWLCIMWLITQNQRLFWQEQNQKALRADSYTNVRTLVDNRRLELATRGDQLFRDDQSLRTGVKILSRAFVGSPRWYHMHFLDAMAICREHGRPEFFVTMTCNPKWPEITDQLRKGQVPEDRPEVVARVFRQKLDALLDVINKGSVFGQSIAHLATIEFQKRGLPHAHILIIVAEGDRLTTPEQVDSVICAELPPDPETVEDGEMREQLRRLEDIVTTNMIHGPCGTSYPNSPCMEDGKCTKSYPKAFQKYTLIDAVSSFPVYRRRSPDDGGRVMIIKRGGMTFTATNAMVVPYNPYLSLMFNCHINVEKSNSARNTKYLYKYVTKGPDRAMVSVEPDGEERPRDEIADFKDLRSVGASEAAYHLYGFPLAHRHPAVTVLRVHDKDDQHVVFDEGSEESALETQRCTELTEFFKANESCLAGNVDFIGANELRYVDMPTKFTYNKQAKKWKKRQPGRKCDTIGRVDNVHPAAGDRFYLRMLLNSDHCKGKTGFGDLKKVRGETGEIIDCTTYQEACQKLGMLQDDHEWEMVLEEATSTRSCKNQVGLFVTIALFNHPADPAALFERFWLSWTDQIVMMAKEECGVELCNLPIEPDDNEENTAMKKADHAILRVLVLLELKRQLYANDKTLKDIHLPEPTEEEEAAVAHITGGVSVIVRDELDFNVSEAAARAEQAKVKFTDEQAVIFDTLLTAVKSRQQKLIFIQAAGGCGKTMLINAVLEAVRSLEPGGCVALATATTGKAAMHLLKGRTFHSRFKAPLILEEDCRLRIPLGTELAKLVEMARLIVIDEATMLNNMLLEALDVCLRDIMNTDMPFGGKVLVLCGDFRQTLPVIPGASRAGIVSKCLNQHPLWQHFEVMYLTKNMRVNAQSDPKLIAWSDYLQKIGDGVDGEQVEVPEDMCIETKEHPSAELDSMKQLIDAVFPDLANNLADEDWLTGRSILTATNKERHRINDAMVTMAPGEDVILRSADKVENEQDARSFSVEYCNSLEPTGLPKHKLRLKPGVPVMLIRNLDPSNGLCNGTRLIFDHVSPNGRVMYCKIKDEVSGLFSLVAIPRIRLRPKEKEYPFEWSRLQFPVTLAFATTINKSQGDTLKMVGIWLPQPVFGHGQLYVAPSRVGAPDRCVFAFKPILPAGPANVTRNIVFQEVLEGVRPALTVTCPAAATATKEVDDITNWTDYDAIEVEMEHALDEDVIAEEGPISADETRRRVEARQKVPTRVQRPDEQSNDQCPPATGPIIGDEPLCEYEQIRESNIDERDALFYATFGYHINEARSTVTGVLGHAEIDSDQEEQ